MATYYIKPTGNDGLDGLSEANAWQSSSKLTTETFVAGDIILFETDGVYSGGIIFSNSGSSGNEITISSFGTGDLPILSSLLSCTGFVSEGGNIWSYTNASMTQDPKVLTIGGVLTPRGRSNYYTITAASVVEEWVEASGLPAIDYTDVQIVVRNRMFIFRTSEIVSKIGNRITYGADMPDLGAYNAIVGFGFFLQNHESLLTSNGDWMYDNDTDTLYIYSDVNPDGIDVKVAVDEHVIDVTNQDYITFSGIILEGAIKTAIDGDSSTNINIDLAEVRYCGDVGIDFPDFDSSNCEITNSVVHDCHSNGIYANYNCNNMIVRSCEVYNCGLYQGASLIYGNSDSRGNGITLQLGTNNEASDCYVHDIGFNAIAINGNNFLCDSNYIHDFCVSKQDGSGIYSSLGGTAFQLTTPGTITNNRVLFGIGNFEGTDDEAPVVFGIYMDDTQNLVTIDGNLCAYMNGSGIYLHNTEDITVTNNTFYSNRRGFNLSQDTSLTIRGTVFTNNRVFIDSPNQTIGFAFSTPNEINQFGTFDNNKYYYLEDHIGLFETYDGGTLPFNFGKSFEEWKVIIDGEASSTLTAFQEYAPEIGEPSTVLFDQTYPTNGSQSGAGLGAFSYFGGGTVTWSAGKAILTKTSGGKQDAYMNAGPILSNEYYLLTVVVDASSDEYVSINLESSFPGPYGIVKSKRILADTGEVEYRILLHDLIADASDQLLWLMESTFGSMNINSTKLELITSFSFTPKIELIFNDSPSPFLFTFDDPVYNYDTATTDDEFLIDGYDFAVIEYLGVSPTTTTTTTSGITTTTTTTTWVPVVGNIPFMAIVEIV